MRNSLQSTSKLSLRVASHALRERERAKLKWSQIGFLAVLNRSIISATERTVCLIVIPRGNTGCLKGLIFALIRTFDDLIQSDISAKLQQESFATFAQVFFVDYLYCMHYLSRVGFKHNRLAASL